MKQAKKYFIAEINQNELMSKKDKKTLEFCPILST